MRSIIVVLLVAACWQLANAKLPSYGTPRTDKNLKFKNGKFRILQIADVHFQNGAATGCRNILPDQQPCTDLNSTAFLTELISREKPNLAIFTGDNIIIGGNKNITESQNMLTKPLHDARVPYMLTFGNHDCEEANCRPELINADRKNPYSLTRFGPKDIHGEANYAYTIAGKNGKPAFALYVFDGGAYYDLPGGSYDYIRPDQVDWYNQTSNALKKAMKGKTIPAAAFFHIPLPEYDTAFACSANPNNVSSGTMAEWGDKSKSGMGKALVNGCLNGTVVGVFQEGVYSANINGGLFSAFVTNGDVRMTNVGHDHVNDFCASLYGIRLCYGGGFGYNAYGKAGWPRRARIIDVYENGTIATYKALDAFGGYARIDYEMF